MATEGLSPAPLQKLSKLRFVSSSTRTLKMLCAIKSPQIYNVLHCMPHVLLRQEILVFSKRPIGVITYKL
jgi:hypothetical protein